MCVRSFIAWVNCELWTVRYSGEKNSCRCFSTTWHQRASTFLDFLEYYYDLLTYLHARKQRLEATVKQADVEKVSCTVEKFSVMLKYGYSDVVFYCLFAFQWSHDDKDRRFKRHAEHETAFLRKRRTRLRVSQFQIHAQVGQGGYGQVGYCPCWWRLC
jgi:hypothetical protein